MEELSKSELAPCPLCGGTPLLSEGPYDWDCGGRYYYSALIECACGLSFEMTNPNMKEYTSDAEALNFVIDAWNTRAERTCEPNTFLADAGENWERWVTECAECGAVFHETYTSKFRVLPNYCPCCGAKVVGE